MILAMHISLMDNKSLPNQTSDVFVPNASLDIDYQISIILGYILSIICVENLFKDPKLIRLDICNESVLTY